MATKLTLSLDEDLIHFAHDLAREKNRSISSMVAEYFQGLQKKKGATYEPQNPLLKSLYGSARHLDIPKDKKGVREVMLRKHLS